MNNTQNTRSAISSQAANMTAATTTHTTTETTQADNPRTKEVRSHHCITIKWSLDSASRRVGLPPVAATAAVAAVRPGAGGGSC
jgi:hypothetical protein